MKKNIFCSALLISIAVAGCGCSLKKSSSGSEKPAPATAPTATAELTTEGMTEKVTAPEIEPSKHEITPTAGKYVYDEAKILSQDVYNECNDYAAMLFDKYLINAAVVTTDKLEGKSPYDYAAAAYDDIYEGRGSGFLLLINNDTGDDILYLTGSCETYVTAEAKNEAFYWATSEIVEGNYRNAILRLLRLGENCPEYIFDNAGILSAQQRGEIERILSEGSGKNAILITSNSTGKSNEQILEEYYARRCKDGGIMAMIDSASNTVIIHSKDTVPSGVDAALKKANTSAKAGEYEAAARTMAEALSG
ncbi:MAG: TPM domain-containing protein [Ruminococcus sp.]|nr:TPM domain-containing protein [Ruminococcus sp.]